MISSLELYDAVVAGVGWVDRTDRLRVEVRGPDRAKFLNNLTTNDVKRLGGGRGCEAFVTSPQGKTLAFVSLLAAEDLILLRADTAAWSHLKPHLEKYGLFDDVSVIDVSSATFEWHFAGPRADELLEILFTNDADESVTSGLDRSDLAHVPQRLAGLAVRLVRERPTGRSGWTLIGSRTDIDSCRQAILSHGHGVAPREIDAEIYDVLRIEAGTPEFGRDLSADNLPQELGRDALAINFVKGCYLGQETVARIDALGHVNKVLRGLRINGDASPNVGAPIEVEGKPVGIVSSTAFSPGWGQPIALAMIRTAHAIAGTRVSVLQNDRRIPALVCDLPMLPGSS